MIFSLIPLPPALYRSGCRPKVTCIHTYIHFRYFQTQYNGRVCTNCVSSGILQSMSQYEL